MLANARALDPLTRKLPIGCSLAEMRNLDFDDLIAMVMMADGRKQVDIAKSLGLTPPAVCHRVRKWESVFGVSLVVRDKSKKGVIVMSEDGHRIVARIRTVVDTLSS